LFDTSQNDTGLVVEALFGFGKFLAEMGDTVTPKILRGVGWLLGRLLAGAVMFGWLLMIIGILMVFVIGGLIVSLRWLILLGAQRTVPTITKPKT
jgi:hypothetical protein